MNRRIIHQVIIISAVKLPLLSRNQQSHNIFPSNAIKAKEINAQSKNSMRTVPYNR